MSASSSVNLAKKKWSFRHFFLFGINFIIGYSFIMGMGSSFAATGSWFLLIIALCGAVAFVTGTAFAKLVKVFGEFGGAYLYCKNAFSSFPSFIVGWFQYVQGIFVSVTIITAVIWAFQGISFHGVNIYQQYQGLIIGLCGLLFALTIIVLFFGFTSTKVTLYFLWAIKLFLILFAVGLSLVHVREYASNITHFYSPHINGYFGIVQSVITFFFAFGGIEGLAATVEDTKGGTHNRFMKYVLVLMGFVSFFYALFFIMMLGGLGGAGKYGLLPHSIPSPTDPNGFIVVNPDTTSNSVNPINNLIAVTFGSSVAGILSLVLLLPQCTEKISVRIQNGWVNTRLLVPLARDQYLPKSFAVQNKYGQFKHGFYFDSILTLIAVVIYIIVLFLSPVYKSKLDAMLDVYTLIIFVEYMFTIAALLKMARQPNSQIKCTAWEYIIYAADFLFLAVMWVSYLVMGLMNDINAIIHHQSVYFLLQISSVGVTFISAVGIYCYKHYFKLKPVSTLPST